MTLFFFFAEYYDVLAVGPGCGENIGVATFAQPEPLPQGVGAEGEMAHADVGTAKSMQRFTELPPVEAGYVFNQETAAGEVDGPSGDKEVTVGGNGLCAVAPGQGSEASGFHQTGVGLIEVMAGGGRGVAGCPVLKVFLSETLGGAIVGADQLQRTGIGLQKQQQLFTLVVYRNDVYLADPVRSDVFDGLAPVKHGREF